MDNALCSNVVAWNLSPASKTPAESALIIGGHHEAEESSIADDWRQVVDPRDIQPGGRYYSVIKLQIRYEKQKSDDQRWAQGTGWLIEDDLLVTAGHCVYDHEHGFGKLAQIKVYAGYNGRASVDTSAVQFRHGARVLTTAGWIKSDVNRAADVAFIRLDSPFQNVQPLKFKGTPTSSSLTVSVVGYPVDKTLNEEPGAQMYAGHCATDFDLSKSALHMLEYDAKIAEGQSGSPVMIQGSNIPIGTHVRGLGDRNAATVIRGEYGNFYSSYQQYMKTNVSAPVHEGALVVGQVAETGDVVETSKKPDFQSFLDTFKQVAGIGSKTDQTVLTVGTPFMGPIGGPIAAVAGAALGFAGKLTQSCFAAESGTEIDHTYKQHVYRAIFSEAALQTVLAMDGDTGAKYGVVEKVFKTFLERKSNIEVVAQKMGHILMEPALRIALHSQASSHTIDHYPTVPIAPGQKDDLGDQKFLHGLHEVARANREPEELLNFLKGAGSIAGKTEPPNVKALCRSLQEPGSKVFQERDSGLQPHFEALCNRAVMGDAALEALMTIKPEDMQAEGFFGTMLDTVKKIGLTCVKLAPGVVRAIEPFVAAAIYRKSTGNGTTGVQPAITGLQPPTTPEQPSTPHPGSKPTKSIAELLKEGGLKESPAVDESAAPGPTSIPSLYSARPAILGRSIPEEWEWQDEKGGMIFPP